MRALPAMPTQPAITVCAPMTQLCATWIWLSSLTPSSITVSPIVPRSTVVLAPISTSLPITTPPAWGILIQRPSSGAKPKPSAPMTTPLAMMQRSPSRHPSRTTARGCRREPAPTTASAPTTAPAPMRAPAPTSGALADERAGLDARRRIHPGRRSRPSPWPPRPAAPVRRDAAAAPRTQTTRTAGRRRRARAAAAPAADSCRALSGDSTTAAARVVSASLR